MIYEYRVKPDKLEYAREWLEARQTVKVLRSTEASLEVEVPDLTIATTIGVWFEDVGISSPDIKPSRIS